VKKLIIFGVVALAPLFAEGPKDFVGTWKADPGTPTMTRLLGVDGNVIVMTEIQPGRGNRPNPLMIVRMYPTEGNEVKMEYDGLWKGASATGKMEGNVLTVDTVAANGTKYHDVWTLSPDKMHYTNEMVIERPPQAAGSEKGDGKAAGPRTVKFSFTRVQ
jgi:hypothetical protein